MFGQNPIAKPFRNPDGDLRVKEFYHTIQGEGPQAGTPAWFLRLAGCNLRCHFSFGWFPNTGKQPFLTMAEGPKKKLGKAVVGDVVLTLNDEGKLVETTIINIVRQKVDQWIRAKIDGTYYYITLEHPFFTNRGMVEAKDLHVGDEILHTTGSEVISYKKTIDNPMHHQSTIKKRLQNIDYRKVGKKISKAIARKKQSGTYVHPYKSLSTEKLRKMRLKHSRRQQGVNNSNYKPDSSNRNFLDLKKEIRLNKHRCARCGFKNRLEGHHIDHDSSNDDWSNLEVLCKSCHTIEHKKYRNFPWYKRRHEKMDVSNGMVVERLQFVDRMMKPPSIRRQLPKLPIVSLTCSPYPTYLADNMWSHNCDTAFDNGELWSFEELCEKVGVAFDNTKSNLLVITGGEPLLQNIIPLVDYANSQGIKVAVETAGTVWQDGLEERFYRSLDKPRIVAPDSHWSSKPVNLMVVSPKTPKIDSRIERAMGALKYIVVASCLDLEDGLPVYSTQRPGKRQQLYRPPPPPELPWDVFVYLQPCDSHDPAMTKANTDEAVAACLKFGYRLSLQTHKIVGLP